MNTKKVKTDGEDMYKVLKMRVESDEIIPKTLFAPESNPSEDKLYRGNNKINIVMIINIIPNSFVLSYLATLRNVLSTIFKPSLDKKVTINVLFMEDIVISKNGAWESNFTEHYKGIIAECEKEEKIRKVLVRLKRSEFESFFNMVLHSFDDSNIRKAVRKGKIKIIFNNLSKQREDLGIPTDNEKFTVSKLNELKCRDFSKSESISEAQRKMFFDGEDRAVILEMGRLLDYWMNGHEEKLIFIATKVFKRSIEECYHDDLWNRIQDGNIVWFNDPPTRSDKMLMYLNPLSRYVNEANDIRYIELEEFYHDEVLTNLKSTLFKHRLEELQNQFNLGEADYNTKIKEDLSIDALEALNAITDPTHRALRDHLLGYNYILLNILQLRSHQLEVINKGFLTVQEETLKQLDLIL